MIMFYQSTLPEAMKDSARSKFTAADEDVTHGEEVFTYRLYEPGLENKVNVTIIGQISDPILDENPKLLKTMLPRRARQWV